MHQKRIRYCTTIFALDRITQSFSISTWDEDNYNDYLKSYNKNYGLHLIDTNNQVSIIMEYSNIIWNYKVFYGSCKKSFKASQPNDERWSTIEKVIFGDLKMIGLTAIYDQVIHCLKNKEYFEYQQKSSLQFKKYCV